MKRRGFLISGAAVLAARRLLAEAMAQGLEAQQKPPQPIQTPPPLVVEVDIDVVSVTAVIFDKGGRFVKGLAEKDVELLEDGVKQDLTYFREAAGGDEKIPLSVALVLDASGSMKRSMQFLQQAATSFVRKLEDVDKALVVSFNESVKGSAEFTDDVDRLEQFVESLQAWGGTSLYDAIHYSLGRVRDQAGRKALVVFSDGDDTTSRLSSQEVIDYARGIEATIYSVGIGQASHGFLKKIATETGGEAFFPDRTGDLVKVFAAISEELRQQYALAYSPKRPPDGTYRAIQLRVLTRKDVEVRVRKGYFAVKRRQKRPRATP
jgi:Ca-activated chloride channel family protein